MADVDVEPGTPPAPEPVAPPEPPPPVVAEDPDAVDVGGQKMVPLAALQAERAEKKALKDKAQRYDEVAGWVQAVRPELEELQRQKAQPAPAPVTAPADDPELVELATTLDLYTREGKPDVERAGKLAKYTERKAQAALQPMQAQTAREKAVENFHRMSQLKTADGEAIDQEALKKVWNATPPEMLADPNIAYVYASAILGHAVLQKPAAVPAQAPPLITEAPGNRATPFARTTVDDIQQKVMAVRGIDSKRYAELTKSWKPGTSNSLEED